MKIYPVGLVIEGRKCVVVGGGRVAERKIKGLIEAGAEVYVVAREVSPAVEKLIREGRVIAAGSEYYSEILTGSVLVFAATDDPDLNKRISEDARRRGIFCNNVTDPADGDVIIPALFRDGNLIIAVTTTGASPALAARLRDRISETVVPVWKPYLEFMEKWRKFVLGWKAFSGNSQEILRKTAFIVYDLMDRHIPPDEGLPELKAACENLLPMPLPDELSEEWEDLWKS
ncbi:precorrin-2 dehydrogenase/sirohydrochlorin ferrochelatase family protein [Thermodesulforhabdus norvegica]|uniref:precorrin-2 dehydrogenase n=1 Tax=Thermodesulforhabdus norvegica TaxID=39841 RepID=A0A1I4UV13_9BACT|nr:bifunctional precorrin-2 dehydrogenase/sirohydrochlorin ferrochelatase [Thermodesulforhabdus norvegica]SFM92725.1 precorrin-2 dehydrogenase / sirohydrochlorin ferrochelatase [Thermodesulforhabdus norvegica]